MTPRNGAGTTDCQRGRIAHTTSATRPIAPIAPSGPPSVVPCGLLDSRMCGASRIRPGDRDAAMPDRGPVDPVEPFLDPWQRADQHEGDREQQDRLRTQELPDVASAPILPQGRATSHTTAPDADEEHDRRGPDLPSDEAPAHAEDPTPRTAGLSVNWAPGALRVFSAERLRLVVCHLGGAGRSSPFGTETLL